MWAHYANAHCGVKIDFKISPSFEGEVYKVDYTNNPPTYNLKTVEKNLNEILTTKKPCFRYESEYRAIYKGENKLPIIIERITLGRRFAIEDIRNSKNEKGDFDDNIEKLKNKIIGIYFSKNLDNSCLKNLENPCKNPIKVFAYKTRYSTKPQEVK